MERKILAITGAITKTNSSSGNYAIPCRTQIKYSNGYIKELDEVLFTWTLNKAQELVDSNLNEQSAKRIGGANESNNEARKAGQCLKSWC